MRPAFRSKLGLDWEIIEIRRLWGGRPREWWDALPADEQAELIAWHRVLIDPAGKASSPHRPPPDATKGAP